MQLSMKVKRLGTFALCTIENKKSKKGEEKETRLCLCHFDRAQIESIPLSVC